MRNNTLKWKLLTDYHSIPLQFYNSNHGRCTALEIDKPYVFARETTPQDHQRTIRKYYIHILPFGHRGYNGYHKIEAGDDYEM